MAKPTLFNLINVLRARSDKPVWDVANAIEVELVKAEPAAVVVRLTGDGATTIGKVLAGAGRIATKAVPNAD